MVGKRKMSGQGVTIPAGIAIGVITSVAVMLMGALLISFLVMNETVPINGIGLGAMCVLVLAAAAGAWLATVLTRQKKLLVSGLTALIFYLVLLSITAVFFGGMFAGMCIVALMILLGAGATVLFGLRKKSGKSKIKIPAYR